MSEDKDLYPKSEAPVGEMPEEPKPGVDSVLFYSYITFNPKRDDTEIMGFAQVELYTNGVAEVISVQPPEFEKFLEEKVYDVEDPYLKLVSEYSVFNQMLASHWRQLPRMWRFNGFVGFIETDEEGLEKLIDNYGWRLDELEDDKKE